MRSHVPSLELLDALAALESRAWTEDGHTAVLERNAAARRALDAGWDADEIAAHLGVWSSDVQRWADAAPAIPRQGHTEAAARPSDPITPVTPGTPVTPVTQRRRPAS